MNRSHDLLRLVVASAAAVVATLLAPATSAAQVQDLPVPPSILVGNYDRLQVGQDEALESGASVARVGDSTAGWHNPAGLTRVRRTVIGASAMGYQADSLRLDGASLSGGASTVYQLPSYFGAVLGREVMGTDRWRIGFSVSKPVSWMATLDNLDSTSSRLSYASRVNLTTLVPMLSGSWAPHPAVRLGAGLGAAMTSLGETQILADQVVSATSAVATLRTVNADGYVYNLTGNVGAQWDVSEHVSAGALVRFPGLAVMSGGTISYHEQARRADASTNVSFSDADARFDYRLPLNVVVGLAWSSRDFEIEADLRWYGPIDAYTMLGSSRPVLVVSTAGDQAPVSTTQPFPGVTNGARQVWNVAVGGHYRIGQRLTVHAGFHTDDSPTSEAGAAVFRSVDLYGATAGLKLRGDHLSGSLGLGATWGTSRPFVIADPVTATSLSTRLAIASVSLLYAVAYQF